MSGNKEIAFLQDKDFNEDGTFKIDNNNKILLKHRIIVIMLQMTGCPPCEQAKPRFQAYANKTNSNDVFCATISITNEKDLANRVDTFIKVAKNGFPCYALYIDRKLQDKEITGRGIKELGEFTGVKVPGY